MNILARKNTKTDSKCYLKSFYQKIFFRSEGQFSRAGCTKSGAGTMNPRKPNFSHLHRIPGILKHPKNQSAGVQLLKKINRSDPKVLPK